MFEEFKKMMKFQPGDDEMKAENDVMNNLDNDRDSFFIQIPHRFASSSSCVENYLRKRFSDDFKIIRKTFSVPTASTTLIELRPELPVAAFETFIKEQRLKRGIVDGLLFTRR